MTKRSAEHELCGSEKVRCQEPAISAPRGPDVRIQVRKSLSVDATERSGVTPSTDDWSSSRIAAKSSAPLTKGALTCLSPGRRLASILAR